MILQEVADSICKATGWKNQIKKDSHTILFELENGLNVNIYSPDGRTLILHSIIAKLPFDEYEAKKLMDKFANHAVSACKAKETIVSFHADQIMLHHDITHKNGDFEINKGAKDFLNDLAWWKQKAISF